MALSDEDNERLRALAPDIVAKIEREAAEEALRSQTFTVEDEEPVEYEDQPVTALVTESGEARDMDTQQPDTVCPACERGSPRRGAEHNCGRPVLGLADRYRHG